jgi:glycosyltransferase involved in cell wall biosynthesis
VRIAHLVCTDAFAGVEQYVAYVSVEQASEGHEVAVFGGSGVEMRAVVGDRGVRWEPASSVWAAQRALVRVDADLLHVHMTAAEFAAVSTKPIHRLPIVSTLHFAHPRGNGRRRAVLYRQMRRHLDAQIAISAFVARGSGEECEVILNGVPWDVVERPREKVVFVAQRLEAEKDTSLAIRAWAMSGLGSRGWRLEIAGHGSQREQLLSLARDMGVAESVSLLGFAPDAKERMASCSIFLATAVAESFGLSVVEAMAAGTPVVLSDSGAHLETAGAVSDDGLFTPGSAGACAQRLTRLVDDEELRVRYGQELRRRWETDFQISEHCRRLEGVYRRVLDGS